MQKLVLTGLSGSGKTTLGGLLAKRLSLPFIDLDSMIEEMAGLSIGGIFEVHGEDYFRALETQAVREASQGPPCVLATGGGTMLSDENVELLRAQAYVVFLDRSVENIARDIDMESRPLLAGGGLVALYRMAEERRGAYLASADAVLPNTGTPGEVVDKLEALVKGTPMPERRSIRRKRPIEELRADIDDIDATLFDCFCRRMELVEEVALCKLEMALPLTDAAREQQVMNHALQASPAHLREETGHLVRTLLELSRRYQARLQKEAQPPAAAPPAQDAR